MVHVVKHTPIHAVGRLFPLQLGVRMPTRRCAQYRRNMIKMITDMWRVDGVFLYSGSGRRYALGRWSPPSTLVSDILQVNGLYLYVDAVHQAGHPVINMWWVWCMHSNGYRGHWHATGRWCTPDTPVSDMWQEDDLQRTEYCGSVYCTGCCCKWHTTNRWSPLGIPISDKWQLDGINRYFDKWHMSGRWCSSATPVSDTRQVNDVHLVLL